MKVPKATITRGNTKVAIQKDLDFMSVRYSFFIINESCDIVSVLKNMNFCEHTLSLCLRRCV